MFFQFDFHERITNDIQFNSSQADLVNFFWRSKFVVTGLCLRKKSNAFVRSGNNWYSLAQRAQERRPLRARTTASSLYTVNASVYTTVPSGSCMIWSWMWIKSGIYVRKSKKSREAVFPSTFKVCSFWSAVNPPAVSPRMSSSSEMVFFASST